MLAHMRLMCPAQVLVGINLRDKKVFDMHRITIASGQSDLDTENPGEPSLLCLPACQCAAVTQVRLANHRIQQQLCDVGCTEKRHSASVMLPSAASWVLMCIVQRSKLQPVVPPTHTYQRMPDQPACSSR